MDEAFLCLKCRHTGHIVQACPSPWPSISGSHRWSFSLERIRLLEKLQVHEKDEICPRCQDLNVLSMFEGELMWKTPYPLQISSLEGSPHYRNLGTVGNVVFRRDCPLCICIFSCAPNPSSLSDEVHILAEWSIHRLERLVHTDSDPRNRYDKCLLVDLLSPDGEFKIDEHRGDALGLLREPTESLALSPRVVDPLLCDLQWVKECLSICQSHHGLPCAPHQSEELLHIQLIDIETRKLVTYPAFHCEYVCLSYVWGPKKAGQYVRDQLIPALPKTIEDAITLCRRLQKRYLWVDSVCIDQDNDREKTQNILRMSSIYKGAYASIISLCGSSMDAGLARIGESTRPVQPQLLCSINGERIVGLMPTLSQQIHNNKWGSRAWTLQEALLSPRCIYISDYQVYFECNIMQCSESLDITSSWIHQSQRALVLVEQDFYGKRFGNGTLRNILPGAGKPKDYMMIYGTLISLYSFRKMKNESDALNAFSGILQHLQAIAHPNGFFWGLPVDELNWSLLWCSYGHLMRRNGFPVWSWAGWKGAIYPGWPVNVSSPHNFWTHFYAWKVKDGKQQLIYPTEDPPSPGDPRGQMFPRDTIFDMIASLPMPTDIAIEDLARAEAEGFLIVDCAICSLEFTVMDPQSSMDYGAFQHFGVVLNGIACTLRTVVNTMHDGPGDVVPLKNLALVGRERVDEWVYHHFLQLDIDLAGMSKRSGVFAVMVPLSGHEALDTVQVLRKKSILV